MMAVTRMELLRILRASVSISTYSLIVDGRRPMNVSIGNNNRQKDIGMVSM